MALLTMREALNQALREEMEREQAVFILGEEVGAYQGAYKVTQGLLADFGEWRVPSSALPSARPSSVCGPSPR
jgi:pyruvate dehydrogenase E1 component beta subunit